MTHYHMRHSVSVIIEKDGKILFVEEKRDGHIFYNEPVGTIEPREPITKAAIREVEEETGYIVKLTGLVGIYQTIHKRSNLSDSVRGHLHPHKARKRDEYFVPVEICPKAKQI